MDLAVNAAVEVASERVEDLVGFLVDLGNIVVLITGNNKYI